MSRRVSNLIKKCCTKENTLFLLISILFVLLFSTSTSILYKNNNGADSAIFMTIGKYWAEGMMPYIDLFDHKGPLIFFVDMLGFMLLNEKIGIMIIQIILMFVVQVFLYKMTLLEKINKKRGTLLVLLTTVILTLSYQAGNLTEEYCLPFIVITLYFNIKYITKLKENNGSFEHNYWYAFFYGISFAVCFLTRVTNAVSICIGVLVITVLLIKQKKWKNLLHNILMFMAGVIIPIGIFAIYFYYNNALYEFIDGTLLYNIKYQTSSIHWWQEGNAIKRLVYFMIMFLPSYIIIFASAICFKNRNYEKAILYLLTGIAETVLFVSGHLYQHYVMIALPNFLIFLIELNNFEIKDKIKKVIVIFLILYSILGLVNFVDDNKGLFNKQISSNEIYRELIELIPEGEFNSFIAYNASNDIYLYYNIKPYYKYFILQDWHAQNSKETEEKIYETFLNGDVKWILLQGDGKVIQTILDDKYEVVESNKMNDRTCTLYRIK